MTNPFTYPIDTNYLLRKKKSLRRKLLERSSFNEKRVAILGGSTTAEIKDMVELFLLHDGIRPVFYESGYNRFYEDVMFPDGKLKAFAPDLIYLHTTNANVRRYPSVHDGEDAVEQLLTAEIDRFVALWERIESDYACPVIQNNFELPHYRTMGNLDASDKSGRCRFIGELNSRLSLQQQHHPMVYINDINYLSAWFGLERWYDRQLWYAYKYAMSYEAIPLLGESVASIISALSGKSKKCLVLDLDNTLWGGVIGDDDLGGIRIGRETAEAEAYSEFQLYVRGLRERGVILAVCSKNDEQNARKGLNHPDSLLPPEDFAVICANWDVKHENIREIANTLNIGTDSMVFVDDNPVEREVVRAQVPDVTVPEMGSNVANYINILDKNGLFATATVSADDLQRTAYYTQGAKREEARCRYETYDEFLRSLEMVAEIRPFYTTYLDRITQLINKTNQFNVTTRRCTLAEIKEMAEDEHRVTLYGRLADRFGDNGLVSVMAGTIVGHDLHLDLWLMSCRVLKRGMEGAMLDTLVARARVRGVRSIVGHYLPSGGNGMVSELYRDMGFQWVTDKENGETVWSLDLSTSYVEKNRWIKVNS